MAIFNKQTVSLPEDSIETTPWSWDSSNFKRPKSIPNPAPQSRYERPSYEGAIAHAQEALVVAVVQRHFAAPSVLTSWYHRVHGSIWDNIPIGSMVLLYMVTWIPSIYPKC